MVANKVKRRDGSAALNVIFGLLPPASGICRTVETDEDAPLGHVSVLSAV